MGFKGNIKKTFVKKHKTLSGACRYHLQRCRLDGTCSLQSFILPSSQRATEPEAITQQGVLMSVPTLISVN